ncbi:TBC-domain-containing protein [Trichodelitschia bisporula]|uniref:TBC-domain-containing protein n=1 Tax=Trichodelitschia bisporula TaxID=703511 RepID=A0A6G1HQ30_9PEZI|nr:TBC-domain-containing protein [Trichodelitschia bisporula]
MFSLQSLVQKAQQLIDPALLTPTESKPSKSSLFRLQFRLPDTQNPLHEITAELILSPHYTLRSTEAAFSDKDKERLQGNHYVGKLHLSEQYMCFSTQASSFLSTASASNSTSFTGQTHGTGPAGNGFTLPLCAIRRVERLNSQHALFALAITTSNGILDHAKAGPKVMPQKFTVQLAGSRQQCERFCDALKRGLRAGMKDVDNLRKVISQCYSEYHLAEDGKDAPAREAPDTGLGAVFKYPGDARKLRDKAKMRLWKEYMRENGRNATLIRQPTFHKLIRVGLPNRLRGEMWELSSGSFYLRLQNPGQYTETLSKHSGKESLAIDEIEKDLNRSLPEYPGFQSEEGIGRLRRVLTAYSWTNAEVGYCQAMNIVVAALLIYMSESQAFYILSVLCDNLLPGYYSTTMYGTLLDQRVFESLVEKTMPILWDHLHKSDVQLSVVSLPWFLSLYINSMPLVFAFRVLDVFFLEGPKVLFQIGLAILRINGEELLDAADDGSFISVLKTYFSRLDESAHPKSENPKLRAVTRFQELMVVAFKEFAGITHDTIVKQRAQHKEAVLENIESFAKRTSIRNLGPESKKLSLNDLGFLYDRFYGVLYERQQRMQMIQADSERRAKVGRGRLDIPGAPTENAEIGRVALSSNTTEMDYNAFREFLVEPERGSYFSSTRTRNIALSPWGSGPDPADDEFMRRLFRRWDADGDMLLTLQDVVVGFARVRAAGNMMENITYFFELYDDDGDGRVDRDGILKMSEALLFLGRRGVEGPEVVPGTPLSPSLTPGLPDERFLGAVSAFIRRCFEYADPEYAHNAAGTSNSDSAPPTSALQDFSIGDSDEDLLNLDPSSPKRPTTKSTPSTSSLSKSNTHSANAALDPAHPLSLSLGTFRMVILADEVLEHFFDTGLPGSFQLADGHGSSANLTTFKNLGRKVAPQQVVGGAGAGVVPPAKGLRGMLDGIVSDGMRVASEVRRRMEDAQRELDKVARPEEEEEEEEEEGRAADARSVREGDRELLEGAEAEGIDGEGEGKGVPEAGFVGMGVGCSGSKRGVCTPYV